MRKKTKNRWNWLKVKSFVNFKEKWQNQDSQMWQAAQLLRNRSCHQQTECRPLIGEYLQRLAERVEQRPSHFTAWRPTGKDGQAGNKSQMRNHTAKQAD